MPAAPATLTPHYFRHNFVTMLYRAGVAPLKAMKIMGHNEYQTTADIYTHLDQEMLRATADDMADVFKKDPQDKHHWLVDEEAAPVVRRIYQLAVNGKGPGQIAGILRDERIERPSVYLARQGLGVRRSVTDMSRPYDWSATSISEILRRPEYIGHSVNFRFKKESYKSKKFKELPREEWDDACVNKIRIISIRRFERVVENDRQ